MDVGLKHSLNEIVSTARKAARGAGLDDGAAEDLARAAGLATADGEPGLRWLLDALADLEAARALLAAADLLAAGETEESPASPLLPYLLDTNDAPRHGAFEVDGETWHALLTLAHRTYVPASEASRLAGAGPGTGTGTSTTDND